MGLFDKLVESVTQTVLEQIFPPPPSSPSNPKRPIKPTNSSGGAKADNASSSGKLPPLPPSFKGFIEGFRGHGDSITD